MYNAYSPERDNQFMAPHLTKAPIIEAIFEILVTLPGGSDFPKIESLHEQIKDVYPEKINRNLFRHQIKITGGQVDTTKDDLGNDGIIAKSKDGTSVVQFRLDGLSYSRLVPYTSWEDVFEKTMKYWEIYKSKTSPVKLNRIGVRYINLLEIKGGTPFEEVFKSAPPIPVTGQSIIRFANQILFEDPITGLKTQIVHATQPPDENNARILLDIGVYKEMDSACENAIIESTLNDMRVFKNNLFFNTIHENQIRKYQ